MQTHKRRSAGGELILLTACGSQKWSRFSAVCGIIVVKRKITAKMAVIFLKMVDPIGIEPTTLRMRTVRSAAWRTFSHRNYSRTKSKKKYKNTTAAKNGVYSWAKKALPSCKRRAEVLSSCSDIKILWRSTGAYRVRYAP